MLGALLLSSAALGVMSMDCGGPETKVIALIGDSITHGTGSTARCQWPRPGDEACDAEVVEAFGLAGLGDGSLYAYGAALAAMLGEADDYEVDASDERKLLKHSWEVTREKGSTKDIDKISVYSVGEKFLVFNLAQRQRKLAGAWNRWQQTWKFRFFVGEEPGYGKFGEEIWMPTWDAAIVLLGTNDAGVGSTVTQDAYETGYKNILAPAVENNGQKGQIFIGNKFGADPKKPLQGYDQHLLTEVFPAWDAHFAATSPLVNGGLVDFKKAIDDHYHLDIYESLHLNYRGYRIMAQAAKAAICSNLAQASSEQK